MASVVSASTLPEPSLSTTPPMRLSEENLDHVKTFAELNQKQWQDHERWVVAVSLAILGPMTLFVLLASEEIAFSSVLLRAVLSLILCGVAAICCIYCSMRTCKHVIFIELLLITLIRTSRMVYNIRSKNCINETAINYDCDRLYVDHEFPAFAVLGGIARMIIATVLCPLGTGRAASVAATQLVAVFLCMCLAISGSSSNDASDLVLTAFTVVLVYVALLYASHRAQSMHFSAHSQQMIAQTRLSVLESMRRGERLVYHHAKNAMVMGYSTISLFLDGAGSRVDLCNAVKALKSGTRFTHKLLSVNSIFAGKYSPAAMEESLASLCKQYIGDGSNIQGVTDALFRFADNVVPRLFFDLCLDNARLHGVGPAQITCMDTQEHGQMVFTIRNRVQGQVGASTDSRNRYNATESHELFSTGLGIKDLHDICKRLQIQFSSCTQDNMWWVSTITLTASKIMSGNAPSIALPELPQALKIAIGDDQNPIMRMVARQLTQKNPSLQVSTFHLNTEAQITSFIEDIVPTAGTAWDIILIDQHLICNDTGKVIEGTYLLETALKQLNACKVVFSANNTPQNQAKYKTSGADGCIGKGAISVYHELASIFQEFLEED